MSAEQGSPKVLTLTKSGPAPDALDTVTEPLAQQPEAPAEAIDTRTLSRSLFLRLAVLDAQGAAAESPERAYVRDTLIELNLPLVRYAAARFRSRNEPMEDIVQVGTIGLIKAIDRFDCERGVEFPTFAMPTVVGEIKRFFRDTSWSVRVPRRLQELRLALTKASDDLAQKLDRSPTVPELAAVLGVSEEDVVDGLAVGNAYTASSLDSPSPEEDGAEGSLADAPRAADHHAPLLREHDAVADRRGGRDLADACVTAADPHARAAARGPHLGLTAAAANPAQLGRERPESRAGPWTGSPGSRQPIRRRPASPPRPGSRPRR
jgi:RNA polymerase sigma-B factor